MTENTSTAAGTPTIAVAGTGNVGGTLGRALARAGHPVVFASRDGASRDGASRDGAADDVVGDTSARVADLAGAFADADVVVLAVPAVAVAGLVQEHAGVLAGKLIIDATNDISGSGPANSYATITAAVPTARYARAFNSLGFENLAQPRFGSTVADFFFSTSEQDRPLVESLVAAVGGRPVFVGEGRQDVIDGILPLWFALAMGQGRGRHLAFRVLDDREG